MAVEPGTNDAWHRRWSEEATVDDIYYCYRLLLGRDPGEEGLRYWSQRLADEPFTFSKLASYFRLSREYQTSKKARGIKLLQLEDFALHIFEYDWDIGEQTYQAGYQTHIAGFLKQNLREAMTFVDVGASIGYFTLMGAKLVGPLGQVFGVECNPRNCELIYLSLHRNNLSNALVYPYALSDSRKLMRFTTGFSNGVVNELADDAEEAAIVPAVTLDSLVQNLSRIDLVKMDIEGSEAKAWAGMQDTIEKHHPVIVMEFFPTLLQQNSNVAPADFLASIFARGYSARILHEETGRISEALTTADVMKAWREQCRKVGTESRAFLDLALHHHGN